MSKILKILHIIYDRWESGYKSDLWYLDKIKTIRKILKLKDDK